MKLAFLKEVLEMKINIKQERIFEYYAILERCVILPCKSLLLSPESDEKLFTKYMNSFDLFALGISILICVINNQKLTVKYLPFIETLINYNHTHFSLTVEKAISNWYAFKNSLTAGGKLITKDTLYLCTNRKKIYQVKKQGMRKYIVLNKVKILLSDIRGKYRYVVNK